MADTFTFGRGVTQGRIAPASPPEGTYVFELGHAGGRTKGRVEAGDYSEVSQTITHDSTEMLVRLVVNVIEPDESSTDVEWELKGYLDTSVFYGRTLTSLGRSLTLTDIALSLLGVTSPTTIKFRLTAATP